MKKKDFVGVIINSNEAFNNSLIHLIKSEHIFEKLTLYSKSNLNELQNLNMDFLITDIKNKEIIDFINEEEKFNEIPVIAIIDKDEKKNLHKYINYSIKAYIDSEFNYADVYIKLRNTLEYIVKSNDCKVNKMQFDSMFNASPYMSWFKDKNSKYIKVNNSFREYCGKDDSEILGNNDSIVWDGQVTEIGREYDLQVMKNKETVEFEEAVPGKNGYKEFNIFKAPIMDECRNVLGTIGIARDITELKNKDAKLDIILDNIPFGVWLKDKDGIILNANNKLANVFNSTKERIIGGFEADFLSKPYTTNVHVEVEDNIVIKEKKSCVFERRFFENGEELIFKVYKSPVFDISNQIIGIVGLVEDITESRRHHEEVKKIAYSDYLTGLLNRRGLHKYIRHYNNENGITMMVVDIDNFKKINDTFGQYYGDKILKLVGEKLKSICYDAKVARNSGDEFIVVWEKVLEENDLKNKAEEILNSIRMECKRREITAIISCSIGITVEEKGNIDSEKLFLKGDMALYKAKNKGKNQYTVFTQELEDEMRFQLTIEDDIKKAVQNNEIALKYQPQFTPDRELIGFEGLFRWNNEKYRKYPVIDIIKAIEKYDVMDTIGDYILKEAFTFAKEINSEGRKPLVVFVNISPIQIMQEDFVQNFKNILKEVDVNPHYVGIEITETVLLDNIDINIEKIQELKDLGVTIALDDFGTGYSSLNYLVKLPLSKLKIDKSFIQGMTKGKEYVKLVGLIIDISHSLGLPVVAEGVEENDELDILKEMEADLVQGYLFYVPLERSEAKNLALQ